MSLLQDTTHANITDRSGTQDLTHPHLMLNQSQQCPRGFCQKTFPPSPHCLGSYQSTHRILGIVSQPPHPVEPRRAAQREKASSLQPVPSDGLSTPFTWARQQLQGAISLPMQNSGIIMCPRGWRSPVDAKQALRAPIPHISQKAGHTSLPHGLAHKQVWILWVAKSWGDENSQSCHHPLLHSLGRKRGNLTGTW